MGAAHVTFMFLLAGSAAGDAKAPSTRAVALPFWERQVAAGHRRRVPQGGHVNVAIVTAIPPNPCRLKCGISCELHAYLECNSCLCCMGSVGDNVVCDDAEILLVCSHPIADHFFGLGISNKVDYARRHGWEVHLSAENVDSTAVVSACSS